MQLKFSSAILTVVALLATYCSGATIDVGTTSQLQSALRTVQPGDVIQLAQAEFYGFFRASISGTASSPITIQGTPNSILSSWSSAFNLEASHYILEGFTVANAKKGILIDGGSHNILRNLTIKDIDEEGVHFRFFSSDNILTRSNIFNTGRTRPGFGEGVYIGQDYGKWSSPNEPDRCDRNQILFNRIGPCGGENIDIKEGTCCGRIEGNLFEGDGMSNVNFDDSWVDVKGNDYLIVDNEGQHTIKDGYQVRTHMPNEGVSGCRNEFRRNRSNMSGSSEGVAIFLNSLTQCDNSTRIYADNSYYGGGVALTNGLVLP